MRPKNWSAFQHYKRRSPPWIKLHRNLLDDYEFQRMHADSRALAPMLWLLASENQNGEIPDDPEEIAFRLRQDPEEIRRALKPLIDKGFFVCDSTMLSSCGQSATPETETETETETEVERGANAPPLTFVNADDQKKNVPRETISEALEYYRSIAKQAGLPSPQGTARQRKLVAQRLKSHGVDAWREMCLKIPQSDFLCGRAGRENWSGATLDWVCKASNFEKVIEGNYDGCGSKTKSGSDSRYDRFLRKSEICDANGDDHRPKPRDGFRVIEGGSPISAK